MPNLIPVGNYGGYQTGTVISPMLVNSYSTLTIPAFKRAVQFLADNIASFGRTVRKDGKPLPTPHVLEKLLQRRPNPYQNAFNFWQQLIAHAAHRGNGYAQIERDANFRPKALNNLLPEDVCPIRYDHKGEVGVQQYYLHHPTGTILIGADVLHIRSGLSYDGMIALDPVQLHANTFQRGGDLNEFQTLYIQKGTNVRGTIEFPQGVTKEQVDEIKHILRTYFRGADAEEDVLVLSDGAKFTNTTISPQDSELSKQESSITKQIAQIMGIPPEMLYELTEAKYNASIEQQGSFVVRYTFRPWIEQIEDELTLKLLTEAEQDRGYTVHLNPDALLRGSSKEQIEVVAAGVNCGVYTKNEGREYLGKSPVKDDPDADKLKALGDTAPAPASAPAAPTPPAQNAANPAKQVFSGLERIVDAICGRVDRKSEKGLETYSKKSGDERTRAVNVFAESQVQTVVNELTPLSETIVSMGGEALPVQEIAQKYAAAIRKGGAVSLKDLLTER